GRYINDSAITTKVTSELLANKGLGAIHVDVKTTKGVVYLTGSTHTKQEANAAAGIAAHVAGVKSVDNEIRIKQ
ncbi:MAG: BON domain-containing protein, partial [Acidiferrobacter sp.]